MANLVQVAQAAGVSITTASMVLNRTRQENRVSEACAQRVQLAAKRLGYVPNHLARSMKRGRVDMIAVAIDIGFVDQVRVQVSELGNSYFGHLIGAIELTARDRGTQLTIIGPDRKHRAPDRGILGIRQRRFDGLIVPGAVVRREMTDFFEKKSPDVPVVVVESPVATHWPTVNFDDSPGIGALIEHLSGLGHRNALWVQLGDSPHMRLRQKRVVEAARAVGINVKALLISDQSGGLLGNVGAEVDAVEAGMLRHLAEHPCRAWTAVICYSDPVGIGVCSAMAKAGIAVPGDVSVTGFDNIESRLCIPRLTSVDHRLAEMGGTATELLLTMIDDPAKIADLSGSIRMVTGNLIIRSSTAAASIR